MQNVMVDLETMGTRAHAPILAIGACKFSADGVGDLYQAYIPLEMSVETGAVVDAGTVEWWLAQSDEARQALLTGTPRLDPYVALQDFKAFVGECDVWGNGASFDNTILNETAARVLGEPLWPYWKDRCYRTIKSLFRDAPKPERSGHHIALEDAVWQAEHLVEINRFYKLGII